MPEAPELDSLDKDLQRGQRVGEYVIESKLGEGGFGTVYRASHPIIGKLVAIKVLNRQYSVQREMVSRFVEEARAVNLIRHRNIIDIFAFDQLEDGRRYYVMELLDGQTLADHLAQVPRMSLRETLPILRAVGRALDAAHAKGIAHRDLKPENIFLAHDPDGGAFPKLLDFGIAKLLVGEEHANHKTRTGAPIGTPLYMSPEQCRGQNVDHRTDIYAFGIVAFRMLTGRVPFDGDNYMTILMQQMSEQPPAASSFVGDLPLEVDRAISWMLAKDPAARPPSLAKAVEALEHAAAAAGVSSPTWNSTPPPGGLPSSVGLAATLHSSHQAYQTTPGARTDAPTQAAVAANRATTPDVTTPPPPRRTGRWITLGVGALAALGVGGFLLTRGAPGAATSTTDERAGSSASNQAQVGAPPALATVRLDFTGLPDGAVIYDAGHRALGLAKQGLTVARSDAPLALSFEVDGRVVANQQVVPSSDRVVEVEPMAAPVIDAGVDAAPAPAPDAAPDAVRDRGGERTSRRKKKPSTGAGDGAKDGAGDKHAADPDSTERPAGL